MRHEPRALPDASPPLLFLMLAQAVRAARTDVGVTELPLLAQIRLAEGAFKESWMIAFGTRSDLEWG